MYFIKINQLKDIFTEYSIPEVYLDPNTGGKISSGEETLNGYYCTWTYIYNCTAQDKSTSSDPGWTGVNITKNITYNNSGTLCSISLSIIRYDCYTSYEEELGGRHDSWNRSGWVTDTITSQITYSDTGNIGISSSFTYYPAYNVNASYKITDVRFKNNYGDILKYNDTRLQNILK